MRAARAAVLAALAARAHACATDDDCSLNGVCESNTCACDAGWTGAACGALHLAPVDFAATRGGYRHPTTSTWGGNILVDAAGAAHMWIAEMAPNGTAGDAGAGSCGLTTWSSASQITHVVAASPLGPYARASVATPRFSHNPLVRAMPVR